MYFYKFKNPEKIIKEWIHPEDGLTKDQAKSLCDALSLKGIQQDSGIEIFTALWKAFNPEEKSPKN